MYYNPNTKETKSHFELCNYLNASIPDGMEEVEGIPGGVQEGVESTKWYLVVEQPFPENLPEDKKAVLGDIELVDGKYIKAYSLVDLTEEELANKKALQAQEALQQAKELRSQQVANIRVTVDGMEFDGDETAQARMSRVVSLASEEEMSTELPWVLADNTVATVTVAQIKEALRKALYAQAALWVVPYTGSEAENSERGGETQTQP